MPASYRQFVCALLVLVSLPAHAVLTDVRIKGVEGRLARNVRAFLSVMDVVGDEHVPASQITYLNGEAPGEIKQALKPFGYYRVTVESHITRTENGRVLTYVIHEGPPVKVTRVDITLKGGGRDDPALREAVRTFPLTVGEVFVHPTYESGKAAIASLLGKRGYFDARLVQHTVVVNPSELSAVIKLTWKTGPRYRFGEVRFEGGQFTDAFLSRFVPFRQGEFYSNTKVLALQRKLYNTAYFSHVAVDVKRETARDGNVPIVVHLVPNEPNRYTIGFSYGTDTGARLELGYVRRWVNDRGHTFRAHLGLGTRRSDLNLEYMIPVYRHGVRKYLFGVAGVDEQTESVHRTTYKANVSRIGTWGPWERIVSLNYLHEEFRFADDRPTFQAAVLYPELRLSRRVANDALIPTRGWSLTAYVRGGADALLSDTDFLQTGIRARLILPAAGRDRWLFRMDAATTWTSDFRSLPASLRYFAGGSQSIRGYPYEALGPRNARGQVIGGKHLLVASVEYEHMFTENWGMAVFVDAGDAFTSTFEAEYGAGVGLRWRSPIGTVRLDVGFALSRDNDWMLHLVIGPFL